jgi:hypothetical protein
VELDEIQRVGGEVREASLDEGGEVFAVVARSDMGVEAATGLRGNDDGLAAIASERGDEPLAPAIAIDVGRVEEVDAEIHGAVEGR